MAANGFDDDQTRSSTNLAAGTEVSHYKIISKIGASGMGEVYPAEDTELIERLLSSSCHRTYVKIRIVASGSSVKPVDSQGELQSSDSSLSIHFAAFPFEGSSSRALR